MHGFIGTGTLYMDRLTAAGVSQGYVPVGNATKFELKVDSETKKLVSRKKESAGQTLASVTRITGTSVGITLNELDAEILASIFLGEAAARSALAGSVTDEAVTARHGRMVQLAHRNISALVVTNQAGSVTYDEGDDYTVHAALGLFTTLAGGAITDGAALLVDYSYAAETGHLISGATQPIVATRLLLDGKNDVNGKACQVLVHEARIRPSKAVDFLADDFADLEFEGDMLTPTGETAPFQVVYVE